MRLKGKVMGGSALATQANGTQEAGSSGVQPSWQLCLYSHTHWDREWYQPFERFRLQLVGAIDRILDTLDADPRFTRFTLDGQTIVLDDYLKIRPERRPQLERLIRDNRLEIGPWYILPDEFLVSAESIIKNLQEGRRSCDLFGSALRCGYLPDPFGHTWQIPQFLTGFGIDTAVFSRGMGDDFIQLGNEFWWEAPDGSRVLALVQGSPYTSGYCNAEKMSQVHNVNDAGALEPIPALVEQLAEHANTPYLLLAVGCDHETVNPALPDLITELEKQFAGSTIDLTGISEYRERVMAAVQLQEQSGNKLPALSGELRGSRFAPMLPGIYSARIPLKQDNVRVQTMMERYIDPLAALASFVGVRTHQTSFIDHAWRLVLQNQPHDSIGGCSVDSVHDEMPARTKRVLDLSRGILEEIASVVGCTSKHLVFNPHPFAAAGIAARERGGVQWVPPTAPLSLAELDAVVLSAVSPTSPAVHAVVRGEDSISNGRLTVQVVDGTLRITASGDGGATQQVWENVLNFVDVGDAGDEYDTAIVGADSPVVGVLTGYEVHDSGVGIVEMVLTHAIALPEALSNDRSSRSTTTIPHTISTTVRLGVDIPWVEFDTSWDNQSLDHRLRVQVALGTPATTVLADGHYAMVDRTIEPLAPVAEWRQMPVASTYAESVVAIEGDGRGMAVMTRGLHEYEHVALDGDAGSAVEVTLLRGVGWLSRDDIPGRPGHAGPGLETPGAQCIGHQTRQFALMPYVGTWQQNGLVREARRYAAPPLVIEAIDPQIIDQSGQRARVRDLQAWHGLSTTGQLNAHGITVEPAGAGGEGSVELGTITVARDGSGDLIVRLFNPYRHDHRARVGVGAAARVARVRLDEDLQSAQDLQISQGIIEVLVRSGEICTLRLGNPG